MYSMDVNVFSVFGSDGDDENLCSHTRCERDRSLQGKHPQTTSIKQAHYSHSVSLNSGLKMVIYNLLKLPKISSNTEFRISLVSINLLGFIPEPPHMMMKHPVFNQ